MDIDFYLERMKEPVQVNGEKNTEVSNQNLNVLNQPVQQEQLVQQEHPVQQEQHEQQNIVGNKPQEEKITSFMSGLGNWFKSKVNFVSKKFTGKNIIKPVKSQKEIIEADEQIRQKRAIADNENLMTQQLLNSKRYFFSDSREMTAVKTSVNDLNLKLSKEITRGNKIGDLCTDLIKAYDTTIRACNVYLFSSKKSTKTIRYGLVKSKLKEIIEKKSAVESYYKRHVNTDIDLYRPKTLEELVFIARLEETIGSSEKNGEHVDNQHSKNTLKISDLDAPSQVVFRFLTQNPKASDFGNAQNPDQVEFVKNLYSILLRFSKDSSVQYIHVGTLGKSKSSEILKLEQDGEGEFKVYSGDKVLALSGVSNIINAMTMGFLGRKQIFGDSIGEKVIDKATKKALKDMNLSDKALVKAVFSTILREADKDLREYSNISTSKQQEFIQKYYEQKKNNDIQIDKLLELITETTKTIQTELNEKKKNVGEYNSLKKTIKDDIKNTLSDSEKIIVMEGNLAANKIQIIAEEQTKTEVTKKINKDSIFKNSQIAILNL